MTQIHPEINIRLQYIRNTDEYIPKLQIHQHSLLTMKVFSQHNLLAQVFFSVSSRSLLSSRHLHLDLDHHLICIIITGSRSSLDLDHHHWIQIITRSGSSLLDHHLIWIVTTGSSSSLDHHLIWIITVGSRSSLDLDHLGDIITRSGSSQRHHNQIWIIA